MVQRQLRNDLLARLKVSRQALSQRAKRLKETFGPMTTDEAVYIIAHMEGLDISRYLPLTAIDRIRSLVPRNQTPPLIKRRLARPNNKSIEIEPTGYPLISAKLTRDAFALGADVYPALFQLENSIRFLIKRVLSKSGTDWWNTRVPQVVQSNVNRTMNKEKRFPYRDRRGSDPLYYVNFDDLREIINYEKNQNDFKLIIIPFDWFIAKLDEIYMARNNLAHCVPLSPDDISRILILHRDWARLLESAGIK